MQNFVQHYSRSITQRSEIGVPAGEGRISFVDAADVAKVAFHALSGKIRENSPIELSGPTAHSFEEAADLFTLLLKRKIHFRNVSEDQARVAMSGFGIPAWKIEALLELYESYRRGDAATLSPAFQRIVGQPPNSLDVFIMKHREEFK